MKIIWVKLFYPGVSHPVSSPLSPQLKCHKYWPDETQDYGDISVMLVRSEHYSDYNIRTFNVKRVSIDVKLTWFQIQTHCLVSWSLCTELLFCSVFFRKVKKRREKLNSFTLLCGQIMEYLNIQLPCWPFEDDSELITRLMLDLPLCTAGMMSASLRLFSDCLSVSWPVCL